jgi:nucleoside triphosphate diphosphatase
VTIPSEDAAFSKQDRANAAALRRLVAIMARLRDPLTGCNWDSVQTFATIAPYTIEEAYEVADAIERNDIAGLSDELGDLALQIVFHARIAEEAGLFALDDVLRGIADKLERRHPHIFGDAVSGGNHSWETIKAEERKANSDQSALAGVALALPALERAAKLQKRAARTGFDWPDPLGPLVKIHEELAEIDAAAPEHIAEEVGDLLFAVVNFARHLKVDPEQALRGASAKFERRFRAIETAPGFAALSLSAKEDLWREVKNSA